MMEPRPKSLSMEDRRAVAAEIIDELVSNGLLREEDREEATDDLATIRISSYDDGYEIAKCLDLHRGWDCNFAMAEILDGFSSTYRRALELAQKAWAEVNGIAPPLPIGSFVTIPREIATGEITGIFEHGAAQYLVRLPGEPENSRRIVNFEDVALA